MENGLEQEARMGLGGLVRTLKQSQESDICSLVMVLAREWREGSGFCVSFGNIVKKAQMKLDLWVKFRRNA